MLPDNNIPSAKSPSDEVAPPESEQSEEATQIAQINFLVRELTQPSTVILALSQLLIRNEGLEPEVATDIETIAEQALALKKLIYQLQLLLAGTGPRRLR